jgi:hypothetical protein
MSTSAFRYVIEKTWNGLKLESYRRTKITLSSNINDEDYDDNEEEALRVEISTPFRNCPEPPPHNYDRGQFFNLWDYEAVELLFLADSGNYLQVVLGP